MEKYDSSVLKDLNAYIDDFIEKTSEKSKGIVVLEDKLKHINHTIRISESVDNSDILSTAAKFHDIGRFPQYEILGKFDDNTINHGNLGEDYIQKLIRQKTLSSSEELDMIRLVVQFHGREFLIPNSYGISPRALELVSKISMIDNIENACIGVLGYIQRERDEDAKNYKKNNPELDMKSVSPLVLSEYLKGNSFNKNIYCKTYADYALFAASLLIKCLRSEYHSFCKGVMLDSWDGNKNAIDGYHMIFKDMLNSEYVDICMETIRKYFNQYIPLDLTLNNIQSTDFSKK